MGLFRGYAQAFAFLSFLFSFAAVAAPDGPLDAKAEAAYQERVNLINTKLPSLVDHCMGKLNERLEKNWARSAQGKYPGLEVKAVTQATSCGEDASACTSALGRDNITIELRAQHFTSGMLDLPTVVCHEATHAYFQRFSAGASYRALPKWAREGIAVYLSGELSSKMTVGVLRYLRHPLRQIDGLENLKHSFADYLEDALAFEFLDQDPMKLTQVLLQILSGTSVFQAIENVTGDSHDVFLQKTLENAQARVVKFSGEIDPSLVKADLAARKGILTTDLQEQLERIITQSNHAPGSAFQGFQEAYAARLLGAAYSFQQPLFNQAISLLQSVLASAGDLYAKYTTPVRYDLAGALLRAGHAQEALSEYTRIYLEGVESALLRDGATMGLARSYFELTQYSPALAWLEKQRISNTYIDDEVTYLKAVSRFHLCDKSGLDDLQILINKTGVSVVYQEMAKSFLEKVSTGTVKPITPGCQLVWVAP